MTFPLTSPEFTDGGPLPRSAYQPADESPALSWGPLPEGTRSLVVTAFDADAPIPGGLWHWAVKDVPAVLAGLPHAAPDAGLAQLNIAMIPHTLGRAVITGTSHP